MAEIEPSIAVERTPVRNCHPHAFPIGRVCHDDPGAKWQRAMGSGQSVWIHGLAVGHCAPGEAISTTIMGGKSARGFSLHCKGRQGAESNGSDGKETKHL